MRAVLIAVLASACLLLAVHAQQDEMAGIPDVFLEMQTAVRAEVAEEGYCRRRLPVKRCCSASRYCPLNAGVCCNGGKACCALGTQCVQRSMPDGTLWYGCGRRLVIPGRIQVVNSTVAPAAPPTAPAAAPAPAPAAPAAAAASAAAPNPDGVPDLPAQISTDLPTMDPATGAAVAAAVAAASNATAPAPVAPAAPAPTPVAATCQSFAKCYTSCCNQMYLLPTGQLVRTCSTQCSTCNGGASSVLSFTERAYLRRYVSKCESRVDHLKKRLRRARATLSQRLVRKVERKLRLARRQVHHKEVHMQNRLVRARLLRVTRRIKLRARPRHRRHHRQRVVRFDAN